MAKSSTTWKKGQSGNPTGRNGREKLGQLRSLLDPHAEDLVLKAKELAMEGDNCLHSSSLRDGAALLVGRLLRNASSSALRFARYAACRSALVLAITAPP